MTARIPWLLEELLPHDHPMILIDEVHEQADGGFSSTVRIAEDCPFFERGRGVPSYIGIEYIAQTVGALVGLNARRRGEAVGLGYLLGTRRYRSSRPYFATGSELTTRVELEFESGGLARYSGEIRNQSGEQIVTSSVTLYSDPGASPTR